MPKTTVNSPECCYGYTVTSGNWEGLSLSYLLQQVGLDSNVASVNFVAQDGYTVSLQIQEALQPDVIIAYQLNDVALSETLRLVIPEENGNMWIAMITSITMSTSITQPGVSSGTGFAPPNNSIENDSTKQPWLVQTQSTAPLKNNTNTEPTAPPTNDTQPVQKVLAQQKSNPENMGFSSIIVYGVSLGATLALMTATLILITKRKSRARLLSF
jgi:DMSO/TMAO reductase YedYZ molybdopterin-dependent catalytic subunit